VLTDQEIANVTRITSEQNAGRKLVVSAGSWWLGESVRFAEYSKTLGVDVFMPLAPNWAGSASADTLVEYYETISRTIPVMLVTAIGPGKPIPLATLQKLLDGDNQVVSIKDDICGPYGRRLAALTQDKWAFLSGGRKENHLDQLPYGAHAYLSLYMRCFPQIAHRYWAAIQSENCEEAVAIVNKYDIPFMDFCTKHGAHFDAVLRGAMELTGIAPRWRRAPYTHLDDEQMAHLKTFFAERGLS
jgi:5-dehydro-4-deoxyglucarate dehydratase